MYTQSFNVPDGGAPVLQAVQAPVDADLQARFDAVIDADVLVIATEWNEFRNPNFGKLRSTMTRPLIFDGRNLYTLDEMQAEGFEYHSIGRSTVLPPDTNVD